MTIIQKGLTSQPEQILGTVNKTYRFVVSDETEDRDGDIIKQEGWDLSEFQQNPIALMQHKHDQPVGRWSNIQQRTVNGVKQTVADLTLAPPVSDLLKYTHALVESSILNATSVGFRVKAYEKRKDANGKPGRGMIVKQAVLHEISLVSVPANKNAIRIAKSLGVDTEVVKSCLDLGLENSLDDLEVQLDNHIIAKARALLSQKASEDEKPTQATPKSSIWNGVTKPELQELVNKAKAVLNK